MKIIEIISVALGVIACALSTLILGTLAITDPLL